MTGWAHSAFGVSLLAFVCSLIGVGTPGWRHYKIDTGALGMPWFHGDYYLGLFQIQNVGWASNTSYTANTQDLQGCNVTDVGAWAGTGSTAYYTGSDCDKFKASASFGILDVIAGGVGFVLILAGIFYFQGGICLLLGPLAYIVAAVFGLLAVVINANLTDTVGDNPIVPGLGSQAKPGYSSALAIIGFVGYLIAAGLTYSASKKGAYPSTPGTSASVRMAGITVLTVAFLFTIIGVGTSEWTKYTAVAGPPTNSFVNTKQGGGIFAISQKNWASNASSFYYYHSITCNFTYVTALASDPSGSSVLWNGTDCHKFKATQAFGLLDAIVGTSCFASALIGFLADAPTFTMASAVLAPVAGVFGLVALCLYVSLPTPPFYYYNEAIYGYSFALFCIGFIFFIIGGGLIFLSKEERTASYPSTRQAVPSNASLNTTDG